jgi:hypothetical protein
MAEWGGDPVAHGLTLETSSIVTSRAVAASAMSFAHSKRHQKDDPSVCHRDQRAGACFAYG